MYSGLYGGSHLVNKHLSKIKTLSLSFKKMFDKIIAFKHLFKQNRRRVSSTLLRTTMKTKQKCSIFQKILFYKTIHLFLKHPKKKLFLKKGGKLVSYCGISK